jgi:hypothetical protein
MKIMLDCSPRKIAEYRERYGDVIWQLRTPLTAYARATGVPYGVDNGAFKELDVPGWLWLVAQAREDRPIFIAMPDIVGDAARTLELFEHFKPQTEGLPRALVLQDGISNTRIPWDEIEAVFIGGSDQFKISPEAFAAAKVAHILGKHVHLGRCNTAARARNWLGVADSCDGSGMSMYDHMLLDVLAVVSGNHPQQALIA